MTYENTFGVKRCLEKICVFQGKDRPPSMTFKKFPLRRGTASRSEGGAAQGDVHAVTQEVAEEPHEHPPPSLALGHPLQRGYGLEAERRRRMFCTTVPLFVMNAMLLPTSPTPPDVGAHPSKGEWVGDGLIPGYFLKERKGRRHHDPSPFHRIVIFLRTLYTVIPINSNRVRLSPESRSV